MKGIRVDPGARTARAQAGVTWGDLDAETQAFGLATTGGVISTTGIAGLTLGGGVGWLNGRFGLACDNLISADVVTAEGQLRAGQRAGERRSVLGAARRRRQLRHRHVVRVPAAPGRADVLSGPVFHPAARARDVLRFYREFSASEPDELTTYAGLLTGPDGAPLVGLVPCYSGPIEQGEKVLERLRKFGPPGRRHGRAPCRTWPSSACSTTPSRPAATTTGSRA